MNYQSLPIDGRLAFQPQDRTGSDFIDVERLLRMALRQARVVILCGLIGLFFGILYLQTTPPTYVAVSRVLIDEGLGNVVDDVLPVTVSAQNESVVLSQIEIIRSSRLAGVVVDRLNLAENDDFMQPPVSLLARAIGYARMGFHYALSAIPGSSGAAGPSQAAEIDETTRQAIIARMKRDRAIMMLQGNLLAQRVGRSLVIAIGYQSHNPDIAAVITRTYAEAYLRDQLNASFDATERTALWLEGRLAELRQSSQAAAVAVETFRAENGLTAARGTLVTEQQVSELTARLIAAQADTAHALARYRQYQALISAPLSESIGSLILPSEDGVNTALLELKSQYQSLIRRKATIEENFGAEHPQAVALGREIDGLGGRISEELRQLSEGYRSEYEVAQAREAAMRDSVDAASGQSAQANQAQIRLRELEQQATALTALYTSFLDRYERATQQQSFPIPKVRVISEAMRPTAASEPRTIMVLGLSIILGLMMGSGLGVLNEFNERFFRTGDDVTDRLGLKFLGYLPLLGRGGARTGQAGEAASQSGTPEMTTRAKMRVTVTAPTSMFAETLRNAKVAADVVLQGGRGKVIGIVSALPGEGKSTVAANFAELVAGTGARTLAIDGDLRNPGLTRNLEVLADRGLVDAVIDADNWRSLLKYDQQTGLAILPGIVRGRFSHTAEALTSAGMRRLVEEARQEFDYVVVDLPPLGPVVDAKAFAQQVDGFFLVVEWGKTPRALCRSLLESEPGLSGKMLGVVLNKVRLNALARYGSFGGSEQFFSRYSSYYIETPGKPRQTRPATTPRKKAAAPASR